MKVPNNLRLLDYYRSSCRVRSIFRSVRTLNSGKSCFVCSSTSHTIAIFQYMNTLAKPIEEEIRRRHLPPLHNN